MRRRPARAPSPSAAQGAALRPWQSSVSLELSGGSLLPLPPTAARDGTEHADVADAASLRPQWRVRHGFPWQPLEIRKTFGNDTGVRPV